jgi:hypothetical protein
LSQTSIANLQLPAGVLRKIAPNATSSGKRHIRALVLGNPDAATARQRFIVVAGVPADVSDDGEHRGGG